MLLHVLVEFVRTPELLAASRAEQPDLGVAGLIRVGQVDVVAVAAGCRQINVAVVIMHFIQVVVVKILLLINLISN